MRGKEGEERKEGEEGEEKEGERGGEERRGGGKGRRRGRRGRRRKARGRRRKARRRKRKERGRRGGEEEEGEEEGEGEKEAKKTELRERHSLFVHTKPPKMEWMYNRTNVACNGHMHAFHTPSHAARQCCCSVLLLKHLTLMYSHMAWMMVGRVAVCTPSSLANRLTSLYCAGS